MKVRRGASCTQWLLGKHFLILDNCHYKGLILVFHSSLPKQFSLSLIPIYSGEITKLTNFTTKLLRGSTPTWERIMAIISLTECKGASRIIEFCVIFMFWVITYCVAFLQRRFIKIRKHLLDVECKNYLKYLYYAVLIFEIFNDSFVVHTPKRYIIYLIWKYVCIKNVCR